MSETIREKLRSIIGSRRDEMIDDLARHVSIPTGHNFTEGLDTYRALIVARLEALGARAEEIPGDSRPAWIGGPASSPDGAAPPTVVCRRDEPGAPRVLIAGHLDTVFDPAGPFRELTIASDGATAVGPGVVDMKGGVLIALVALEALADAGLDLPWTFLLNSDEEMGSYASDRALRAEAAKHRFGVAMEPALPDGSLAVARKGSGQFMVEVEGRAAHAGRDFDKGVSAVYALAHALTRIEAANDPARGVTLNVGPVTGGGATNVVPDHAAAWGNARYPDRESGDAVARALDALTTAPDSMPRITVRRSFNRPAKPLIPETERLALMAREVAESLGQLLPFASTGGVCDGNILQDTGLPTIDTLGVRGGGLHTHREWIDLASLTDRATLLACLLERLSHEENSLAQ